MPQRRDRKYTTPSGQLPLADYPPARPARRPVFKDRPALGINERLRAAGLDFAAVFLAAGRRVATALAFAARLRAASFGLAADFD